MQYVKSLDLIFVHIPKTGGSFIEGKLKKINKELTDNDEIFGGHYSIDTIINNFNIDDISLYNSFCVVRNPYSRIISAYNYLKQTEKRHKNDREEWKELGSPSSITDFICSIYSKYKNNELSVINPHNWHFQQQYKFVVNDLEKKDILCNILKYENLNKDFEKFMELYKKRENIYDLFNNEIYKNIKIKPDYDILNILSFNDISMINEIYKEDFLLFEYDNIH